MIVELSTLGSRGAPVGSPGGQGAVFRLDGQPGLLVKLYHRELNGLVDPAGLEALVSWRSGLDVRHRTVLDMHSSWPLAVVRDGDQFGVVFQAAPSRFMKHVGNTEVLRDLQWAYCTQGAGFAGAAMPPLRLRAGISLGVAAVLELLHRDGVVLGDLSHTNIAFATVFRWGQPLPVFHIDTDSAWNTAASRGVPRSSTPQWSDRRRLPDTAPNAMSADVFKLALVFLRTWYLQNVNVDSDTDRLRLPERPAITSAVADLLTATLRDEGDRPTAAQWTIALVDLVRFTESRRHKR